MAGLDVNTSDPREQRNFGLVMAGAIAILGLIRYAIHWYREGHQPESLPYAFFAVGAVFLVLGLIAPGVLRPIFIVWMKFAMVMNWIITHLLLSIVWFTMIIPGHVMMSLTGKDPLKRKLLPEAATYWEEPEEQPEDPERYLNQY